MRYGRTATVAAMCIALAAPLSAQLHITPTVGAFHPDRSPLGLDDEDRTDRRLIRGRTVGLGFNLDAGAFRATIAYATQAEILREGIETQGPIGQGRLLAITGGLRLRPIPRFAGLQPYGIAGAGVKRFGYSWDNDGITNALPEDDTDFALQAGAGVDLMLGGFGFVAEVNDMITPQDEVRHDTFLMFGLRLRLGGPTS